MSAISLSIGVSDCDRMRPLADGTVTIPGVDAKWNLMGVQALFNKQLHNGGLSLERGACKNGLTLVIDVIGVSPMVKQQTRRVFLSMVRREHEQ